MGIIMMAVATIHVNCEDKTVKVIKIGVHEYDLTVNANTEWKLTQLKEKIVKNFKDAHQEAEDFIATHHETGRLKHAKNKIPKTGDSKYSDITAARSNILNSDASKILENQFNLYSYDEGRSMPLQHLFSGLSSF